MSKGIDWNALREERCALVDRVHKLPFEEAWQEVRATLEVSPSIYTDDPVPTIYEGPTRSFLLPLPFELLRDFVRRRGTEAADRLFQHTGDINPLVAAYCLHALFEIKDIRLCKAAAKVAERPENIHSVYGSFGWEGSLSEYGRRLCDENTK